VQRNLRLSEVVVIQFRVNDGGGNGRGCCGIEVRVDTVKLTNTIVAGFGEKRNLV